MRASSISLVIKELPIKAVCMENIFTLTWKSDSILKKVGGRIIDSYSLSEKQFADMYGVLKYGYHCDCDLTFARFFSQGNRQICIQIF